MFTEHLHIDSHTPSVYKPLVGVSTAVVAAAKEAALPRTLVELVNVRVSQINGCPTCLEVHHRRAVAAGVTDKQLATLSVWRDTEAVRRARAGGVAPRRDHHHAARP